MITRHEVQAVIFDNKNGPLVLLVQKRERGITHFHWRLLKGGVDEGETKVDALKREILEETGLRNVEILGQVHTYEFIFKGIRHRVSSFVVKADSNEPLKLQESELSDYIWTEPEHASRLLYWHNEKEALGKLAHFSDMS